MRGRKGHIDGVKEVRSEAGRKRAAGSPTARLLFGRDGIGQRKANGACRGIRRVRKGREGDCRQGKERWWTQQQRNSGRASLEKGSTPANQLHGVIRRADVDEASEQYRIPLSLMLAKASEVRERTGAVSEDHMGWAGMEGYIAWR